MLACDLLDRQLYPFYLSEVFMKKVIALLSFVIAFCCFAEATEQFTEHYFDKVRESASWLQEHVQSSPELLIVVTAGVKGPEDLLTDKKEISSSDIPYFPIARVQGHAGKILFGRLDGKDVVIMKGRYHYYEGLSPQEVVFPYFVLHELGVKSVITTNAVGGIRHDLDPGDIMLVTDQINGLCENPLRGISVQRPTNQFTGMTQAYWPEYQELAKHEADKLEIPLKEGVYTATMGPSYETKSEIKMLRNWGADAVGMSTIFEIIACNYLDMKVLTFCCISNPAADRHTGVMTHEEVLETMQASGEKISTLVNACARQIIR